MKILKAKEEDLTHLGNLFHELHCLHVNLYPTIFRPVSKIEAIKILTELSSNKEVKILIATEGSSLFGYVLFRNKIRKDSPLFYERVSIFVEQIYVVQEYRHKGVARLLLEEVEKFAKASNISSVESDLWATNSGALEFFRSSGYNAYNYLLSKQIAVEVA